MTKKEKVQIDNLLARLKYTFDCCNADNALCKDEDGAYTHNAMVVHSNIIQLINELQDSIDNDKLLIHDNPY